MVGADESSCLPRRRTGTLEAGLTVLAYHEGLFWRSISISVSGAGGREGQSSWGSSAFGPTSRLLTRGTSLSQGERGTLAPGANLRS